MDTESGSDARKPDYLFYIDSSLCDESDLQDSDSDEDEDDGDEDLDNKQSADNRSTSISSCSSFKKPATSKGNVKKNLKQCWSILDNDDRVLSIQEVKMYLEWFMSSCGNQGIQLGRYKPGSTPELYVNVNVGTHSLQSNSCLLTRQISDNGMPTESSSLTSSMSPSSTSSACSSSTSMASDEIQTAKNLSERPLRISVTLRNQRIAEAVNAAVVSRANSGAGARIHPEDPFMTSDEFILRELADIRRLLLQRFLSEGGMRGDNVLDPVFDLDTENELFDILSALTDEGGVPGEPLPHFPVGEWVWIECEVCLEHRWLYKRPCCGFPVCHDCLKSYFGVKVNEGVVKIECCSPKCKKYVHRDEISARLEGHMKQKFYQFLVQANADPFIKTCPRCNHITSFLKPSSSNKKSKIRNTKNHPERSRIVCPECSLTWCFCCHAPWHPGFTCRQFRKGDRLLKSWAHEMHHGQLNAQKCPKCQVYIQRTTGCDHMHCTRCKTDFCYRCGDRLRKLRFFGDHYSKLSIFGCKYRYKANQPIQRKMIRGAVFGGKLMVAPLLGTLGACAGVIALGFGIFILPVYGGVRLYQKFDAKRQEHYRFEDFPTIGDTVRLEQAFAQRMQEIAAGNQQATPHQPPSYHRFEVERL